MTKAFLEPMIIKTESEKLIMNAFSQKSLKKSKYTIVQRELI